MRFKTPPSRLIPSLSIVLAASSMLCACSPGAIGLGDRDTRAAEQQAARYETISRSPYPAASPERFHLDTTTIIPGDGSPPTHGQPLPDTSIHSYSYPNTPMTLSEIARIIGDDIKIPVVLAPDMITGGAGSTTGGNTPAPPSAISPEQANQALSALGMGGASAPPITPVKDSASTYVLHDTGTLDQILSALTSHFNCTWVYDGHSVVLTKYLTRTYSIHSIASNTVVTNSLTGTGMSSSGGSGGGGGGGSSGSGGGGQQSTSSQNVSSTLQTDTWTDVKNGVLGIVGSHGVTDQQSTGTITVTAEPATLERVQEFIDRENDALSNLVTVSIEIVNLDVNVSDTDSFNPDLILKGLGAEYNLGLYAASQIASAASSAAGSSTGSSGAGNASISSSTPSPGLTIMHNNSSALITALSSVGRAKVVYRYAVTTMNGGVAPFSRTNTVGYVSNMSVTNTGSSTGGTQTSSSISTGTVTTGLNIAVIPRIDERNRTVLLQEAISQSALTGPDEGFRDFTSPDGSERVQLPIINATSSIAYLEAPSGETIILTGYSGDSTSASKNGSLSPENILFGGAQSGGRTRSMTFYLITPVIEHITHKTITTTGM